MCLYTPHCWWSYHNLTNNKWTKQTCFLHVRNVAQLAWLIFLANTSLFWMKWNTFPFLYDSNVVKSIHTIHAHTHIYIYIFASQFGPIFVSWNDVQYSPFERGIRPSSVITSHTQTDMWSFGVLVAWTNCWTDSRVVEDMKRHATFQYPGWRGSSQNILR